MRDRRGHVHLWFAILPILTCAVARGDCTASVVNNVGDRISITVTLQTDDQDEDGEGEPVLVSTSGGEFSTVVSTYFAPQSFSFPARSANETITGTLLGGDDDEDCTITAAANQEHFLSDSTKQYFSNQATILAVPAAGFGLVAAGCFETIIAGPICGLPAGTIAAGFGLPAALAALIALDPPDPNYQVIATPVISVIPQYHPTAGIPQSLADATNMLLSNQAQAVGITRALVTTLNRLSGASEAKDSVWVQRQTTAANSLEAQLSSALVREASLVIAFDNARRAANVTATFTSDDAGSFEAQVASDGLPDDEVAALQQFGADSDLITAVSQVTYVVDVDQVAQFPDTIASPELVALLLNSAQALLPHRRAVAH